MINSTTQGQLYLTALDSNEKLEIQFVPKMRQDFAATYGEIQVVGRNNPINHYTGGDERLFLDLDFLSVDESREDVIRKCNWLKSIAMNDGYSKPPEKVRVTFGKLFQREVWIIESINISYERFESASGFLPVQAYVALTLKIDTDFNRKRKDVLWR